MTSTIIAYLMIIFVIIVLVDNMIIDILRSDNQKRFDNLKAKNDDINDRVADLEYEVGI